MSGLYNFGNGLYNTTPDTPSPWQGECYPSFTTMLLEQRNATELGKRDSITPDICLNPAYLKGNPTAASSPWGRIVPVSQSRASVEGFISMLHGRMLLILDTDCTREIERLLV